MTDEEQLKELRSVFVRKCEGESDWDKLCQRLHVIMDINVVLQGFKETM